MKCVQRSGVFPTGLILHITFLSYRAQRAEVHQGQTSDVCLYRTCPLTLILTLTPKKHIPLRLQPRTFLLSSLEFPTSVLRSPNLKRFHFVFVTCEYPAPAMKTGICKTPLKKKKKEIQNKMLHQELTASQAAFKKKVFTLPTVAGSWSA